MNVRRYFLTVGDRQLHYRHAGSGAPLILFHACPKSSVEQMPLIEKLSVDFSVFAFDLPGYGDSDILAIEQPEIADFADHFALALDVLGIDQCSMYGRHTGGLVAVEFGRRHRDRLISAVFDGFPVFTEEERRRFLTGYLQPLVAQWDGLHLPGLWARIRENYLFFPWNEGPVPEHRNDMPMPMPEQIHLTAVDMLKVMDRWRVGYASAFRYRPHEALAAISYPAMIMARRDDLLFSHLPRLPALPRTVKIEAHSFDASAWALSIHRFMLDSGLDKPAPPPATTKPRAVAWSNMISQPNAQLRIRRTGNRPGNLMIIHDLPGSSQLESKLIRGLKDNWTTIVPDLPGIGLTSYDAALPLKARLLSLIDTEMDENVVIVARGLAANIALHLAKESEAISKIIFNRPRFIDEGDADFAQKYVPDLSPDAEGTYLTKCWYSARDSELYWPWYRRDRESIRFGERRLDPSWINGKVVSMIENGENYVKVVEELAAMPLIKVDRIRSLIIGDDDPVGQNFTKKAKELIGDRADVVVGPDTEASELEIIVGWLARHAHATM